MRNTWWRILAATRGRPSKKASRPFVAGLAEALHGLRSKNLTLLLENTAGSGAAIGSQFEELAAIRRQAQSKVDFEIGYCIDTCHAFAAGYDISTRVGLQHTVAEIERVLTLECVPVIHTKRFEDAARIARRPAREYRGGARLAWKDFAVF